MADPRFDDQRDAQPGPDDPGMVRDEVTGELIHIDDTVVLHGLRVGPAGKAEMLAMIASGQRLPGPIAPAGALARVGAAIVDNILLTLMLMPLFCLFGVASVSFAFAPGGPFDAEVFVQLAIQMLVAVASFIYFGVVQKASGQTLAKKSFQLRVVRVDGARLDMTTMTRRWAVLMGPFILAGLIGAVLPPEDAMLFLALGLQGAASLFVLVNLIVVLIDGEGRGIHDRAAGTRVIAE